MKILARLFTSISQPKSTVRRNLAIGMIAVGVAVAISSVGIVQAAHISFKCSTGTACIQGISSGASTVGVLGTGTSDNGVQGQTSAAGAAGVAGLATGSGLYGIYGSSLVGPGLYGTTSSSTGSGAVEGYSTSGSGSGTGVVGESLNGPGVSGSSNVGAGLYGETSASGGAGAVEGYSQAGGSETGVIGASSGGTGVYGASNGGPGVSGSTSTATGQAGVEGFSNSSSGTGYGVSGSSTNGAGVYGQTTAGGQAGVLGESVNLSPGAVIAQADSYYGGIFYAHNEANGSSCEINYGATLSCSGGIGLDAPAVRIQHRNAGGQRMFTYASESASATIEDVGTARMANGVANVQIDPAFASVMDRKWYYVFLTPLGDTRGLYVSVKTPAAFQVREAEHGRSNLEFDYRIVANPVDEKSDRLPPAPEMKLPRSSKQAVMPARPMPPPPPPRLPQPLAAPGR